MDTTYDRLIHLYLEGRLDAASEELLFRELSNNADLRREMNTHIRLQAVAKRDAARVLPTERDKAAIFGRLGFAGAATSAMAGAGTASTLALPNAARAASFLSPPRLVFAKQTLRYAATILVTAFLTWWLLRYGIGGNNFNDNTLQTSQIHASEQPVEMTMMIPIEKRVVRVVEKQIEKQIVTRVETRYKTIVRYLRQDEDSTYVAQMLASEQLQANNTDAHFVTSNLSKEDAFTNSKQGVELSLGSSTHNNSSPSSSEYTPLLEGAPILASVVYAEKPDNSLLVDSLDVPLFPRMPMKKAFVPTAFIGLRASANLNGLQGGNYRLMPLDMGAVSFGYNWQPTGILGIEASADITNARYEQTINASSTILASVFYRHILSDWTYQVPAHLASVIGDEITPFVQTNLGTNTTGDMLAGRVLVGATMSFYNADRQRGSNSLALELTHFLSAGTTFVPKVSLSFAHNFQF